VLLRDGEEDKALEIPDVYMREMLAGWRGAGMAKFGEDNTLVFYARNRGKMQFTPRVRAWIEEEIGW